MSAVFGVVRWDDGIVEPEEIAAVGDGLFMHGPDGRATWREAQVALGRCVTRTHDRALGVEGRVIDEYGRWVLACDARIDNRDDLLSTLGVGHALRTKMSDGEVILRAYERWGEDCGTRLIGSFVFALWDTHQRRLFCARDAFESRWLYYHHGPGKFVFATDAEAAACHPDVPRDLDEEWVAGFLALTGTPGHTRFSAVSALPPAHSLSLSANGHLRIWRNWEPDLSRKVRFSKQGDYVEGFRVLLDEAVQCRIRGADGVGAFLSGGLDSSSVACLAARKLQQVGPSLHTFSFVLPPGDPWPQGDERPWIEEVLAAAAGATGHFVTPFGTSRAGDFASSATTDADSDGTPRYYRRGLALARDLGVSVMLEGRGGDSCVSAPYAPFGELLRTGRWLTLLRTLRASVSGHPPGAWQRLAAQGARALRGDDPRTGPDSKGRALSPADVWLHGITAAPAFAARLDIEGRIRTIVESHAYRYQPVRVQQWSSLVKCMLSVLTELALPELGYFGIELRTPLLDRRLVEFALAVPPEQLHDGASDRLLLRRAMEDLLPAKVRLRRTKYPGAFPGGLRFLTLQRRSMRDDLERWAGNATVRAYVDIDKVRRRLCEEIPAAVARGENRVPGVPITRQGLVAAELLASPAPLPPAHTSRRLRKYRPGWGV